MQVNSGSLKIPKEAHRVAKISLALDLPPSSANPLPHSEASAGFAASITSLLSNEQLDDSTRRMVVGFETPDGPEARGITFIKEGEDWFPVLHISGASETWDHTSFEGSP